MCDGSFNGFLFNFFHFATSSLENEEKNRAIMRNETCFIALKDKKLCFIKNVSLDLNATANRKINIP